jgi:hypothetical protein
MPVSKRIIARARNKFIVFLLEIGRNKNTKIQAPTTRVGCVKKTKTPIQILRLPSMEARREAYPKVIQERASGVE